MIIIQQRYIPTLAGVRRVIALARALSENGYSVRVIYLAASENLRCREDIPNVTFEYWGDSLYRKSQILGMISSAWKLLFCLPKDIIYFYGMNPLIMLFLLLHNRKYLHEFTEYPGFIFGNSIVGKLKKWIHVMFMKKCQKVFVISKRLRGYCIENGIPEDRVGILNMFVDVSRFKDIERNSDEKYIGYCGNGENFKDGVDVLIKAFYLVAQKYNDVKLIIAGRAPQKDWESQQTLVSEYGLKERVKMLGKVSPDKIPSLLLNAEVLALARPDNIQAAYGFPTKVGEYLATGRPVVLTRVGELEDFLENRKSCLFADPDSSEDFANNLCWLLDHPKEAALIGANGKKVAKECFDNVHESEKVIDVLKTLSEKKMGK